MWEEPRRDREVLGGPLCTGVGGVPIDGLQIALTTDTVQKYLGKKVYPWYNTVCTNCTVLLLLIIVFVPNGHVAKSVLSVCTGGVKWSLLIYLQKKTDRIESGFSKRVGTIILRNIIPSSFSQAVSISPLPLPSATTGTAASALRLFRLDRLIELPASMIQLYTYVN